MASASIVIEQSGVAGAAGKSRDDIATGSPVAIRNANDEGVRSWRWKLEPPKGSTATLSNVTAAAPVFTPDVTGTYVVSLAVNEGRTGETDKLLAAVRNPTVTIGVQSFDTRYIGIGEDGEANWTVDLGAGPVTNTTGWWEDLDRWTRLIQAVAVGGGGGGSTLQGAYDAGPTIVTSGAVGALQVSGTEDFDVQVTGSVSLQSLNSELRLTAAGTSDFAIDANSSDGVRFEGVTAITATTEFEYLNGLGGYQTVRGANPVGANDFVTKQYAAAAYDSRLTPATIAVGSGASGNGTIAIGLPKGTQGYLRVSASAVTDGRVKFYSDVARTKLIYEAPAAASPDHDFTSDFVDRTPAYLLADDGTDLAADTIYYTIDNSGGAAATFSIYQIITG